MLCKIVIKIRIKYTVIHIMAEIFKISSVQIHIG